MLLTISLFTIFLSVLILVNNWKGNKNAVYLSLFIIITAIYGIAHYFVMYGHSAFWLAIFYNHFTPLMLLLGPLLYCYIRGVIQDSASLTGWDWLHGLPALIHAIGILPYTLLPFDEKLQIAQSIINNVNVITEINVNYWYSAKVSFLLRTLLLLVYLLFSGILVWRNYSRQTKDEGIPKRQMQFSYRWLVIFLLTVTAITVSYLALTIESIQTKPSESLNESYPLYLLTGSAFCSISFILLLFPNILYGIPRRKKLKYEKKTEAIETPFWVPKDLQNEPFEEIAAQIMGYLNQEKPYLNPDFSLTDITIALKISQNHINYCINEVMQTKFSDLKSKLRVNHSIVLLQNNLHDSHTIEAIGEQSGFKSRSKFYAAFKERTGQTPSEFVEREIENKNRKTK
jgi:AraC-like DNA-binding protein